MNTLFPQHEDGIALNAKCRVLLGEVLAEAPVAREAEKIRATADLFGEAATEGNLLLLKEGMLTYSRDDRVIFFYEEGDLVGLDSCFGAAGGTVGCEMAVVVDVYRGEDLLAHIGGRPELLKQWNAYLVSQVGLFSAICGSLLKTESTTTPEFRQYQEGDVVIEQGATDTDVYTLVDGHADVHVDGVRVGEIASDEIFGSIAALMDAPRTATVVASCDSTVLVLPKANFVDLIEARPGTVLKMVEEMAGKIVKLNETVVGLQSTPA